MYFLKNFLWHSHQNHGSEYLRFMNYLVCCRFLFEQKVFSYKIYNKKVEFRNSALFMV